MKGLFADRTGLEPATSSVTGMHSNQLNYRSFLLRECKYIRFFIFSNSCLKILPLPFQKFYF
jgi:hypothetical protein